VRLFAAPAESGAEEETAPLLAAETVEEEVAQLGPPDKADPHEKRGVRKAARELGKPRTSIDRDLKIAAAAPEAKAAAVAAGLDDNQSALLEIAAEPTPEAQVAKHMERRK